MLVLKPLGPYTYPGGRSKSIRYQEFSMLRLLHWEMDTAVFTIETIFQTPSIPTLTAARIFCHKPNAIYAYH